MSIRNDAAQVEGCAPFQIFNTPIARQMTRFDVVVIGDKMHDKNKLLLGISISIPITVYNTQRIYMTKTWAWLLKSNSAQLNSKHVCVAFGFSGILNLLS